MGRENFHDKNMEYFNKIIENFYTLEIDAQTSRRSSQSMK